MPHRLTLFLGLALSMAACTAKTDTLMGSWKAEKVNVAFDERMATPALVQQIGEMERQNSFTITADSILVFKGFDENWQERIHLVGGTTIRCGETLFGEWMADRIVTRSDSPLGEMVVTYRKE